MPLSGKISYSLPLVLSVAVVCAAAAIVLFVVIYSRKRRNKADKPSQINSVTGPEQNPGQQYSLITDRLRRVEKKYKSFLFAAVNPASLPLTIPINVAIQLARENKRCLLIDLDLKRNAIARAFELNPAGSENTLQVKAFQTELKNLWVWPAHNFTRLKQMQIKPIVAAALERFDFVLINAPYLTESPDRRQIASAAQAALIFGDSAPQATRLAELIKSAGSVLIGNIQTPPR